MQAVYVDIRYLMFVTSDDENYIEKMVDEIAKSITNEFILREYYLPEDFDL